MDPGSIASTALGAAASGVASKTIDKAQEKWGMMGVITTGAIIISALALFQAVKTRSFRGILG